MNAFSTSGAKKAKITVPAFIILGVILCGAFVFLVLTFIRSNEFAVLRKYCVTGDPSLVTAPLTPLSPPAYVRGSVSFHKTEPYAEWDLSYGNLGSAVTSIDVRGPLLDTDPPDGPVYVVLCLSGSLVPCTYPATNLLKQRTKTTIALSPLDDYVDAITARADRYKFCVNTAAGSLCAALSSLC
jgi:hypothetical protein